MDEKSYIRHLCYELYKIDWERSHGITSQIKMDYIKDYYLGLSDDDSEYTYEDYLFEFGYNGELYACYNEFLENEYLDKEYICSLLDNENFKELYIPDSYDIVIYGIQFCNKGNQRKEMKMGYRSVVRIMTNLEGFEDMQEIAYQMQTENNLSLEYPKLPEPGADPLKCFDHYDAQENYLCFGWDWIKWYEEYQDVRFIMDVLEKANEANIAWQFMRLGEDNSDVENISSDSFYDNGLPIMSISVDIAYQ